MNLRKNAWLVLLVALMLLVAACSSSTGGTNTPAPANTNGGSDPAPVADTPDQVFTLNVATALTGSDPIYVGLGEFKKSVEEKTNGGVEIQIHGSGSLGEDSDILEQAMVGANVAVLVDAGRLAEMVPAIGVLAAPYVVDSFDEANTVAQSDLFQGWSDELAANHSLQILSFNWYQGDRHILADIPVSTPEDLNGVTLRTPGAPVWLETVKAMGASPAGMPFSEVYPAIQSGVIDGTEAQHPASYGANLHEVVSYISKTSHFQLITGIVTSAAWMDSIPAEYQTIIYEEAIKAGEDASYNTIDMLDDFEQKMVEEGGVTIHEVDTEIFKQATESVYDFFDGYQELRQEINNILGK